MEEKEVALADLRCNINYIDYVKFKTLLL